MEIDETTTSIDVRAQGVSKGTRLVCGIRCRKHIERPLKASDQTNKQTMFGDDE